MRATWRGSCSLLAVLAAVLFPAGSTAAPNLGTDAWAALAEELAPLGYAAPSGAHYDGSAERFRAAVAGFLYDPIQHTPTWEAWFGPAPPPVHAGGSLSTSWSPHRRWRLTLDAGSLPGLRLYTATLGGAFQILTGSSEASAFLTAFGIGWERLPGGFTQFLPHLALEWSDELDRFVAADRPVAIQLFARLDLGYRFFVIQAGARTTERAVAPVAIRGGLRLRTPAGAIVYTFGTHQRNRYLHALTLAWYWPPLH